MPVDMLKEGIIDPAKVSKCVMRNAVSVAIQFIIVASIFTPGDPKK